jgi:hypothetical protein
MAQRTSILRCDHERLIQQNDCNPSGEKGKSEASCGSFGDAFENR